MGQNVPFCGRGISVVLVFWVVVCLGDGFGGDEAGD